MAPGTRANPDRGEENSYEPERQAVVPPLENREQNLSREQDSEGAIEAAADEQSHESSTTLRMEKLESTMSRLMVALEYFENKYAPERDGGVFMSRKPHSDTSLNERFSREHSANWQILKALQ